MRNKTKEFDRFKPPSLSVDQQQQQEEGSAGFELPVNLPTGFADLPLLNDRMTTTTTTTSLRTATSSTTTAKVSVVDQTEEEKVFDEIPLDNIDPDFEDFDFELPGSTTQKSGTYNFFFVFIVNYLYYNFSF